MICLYLIHYIFYLFLLQVLCKDVDKRLTEQVYISGGKMLFGSTFKNDGGLPQKQVTVRPFYIDLTAVTNEQFRQFIRATKYKTETEHFGWSFVLEYLCPQETIEETDSEKGMGRVQTALHWLAVIGAHWRKPEGSLSSITNRLNHPVVQVTWNDANEYCHWAGRRLPTEIEWEFAARGGAENTSFHWGNEIPTDYKVNVWQGKFPLVNEELDGYAGTAPVDAYQPNQYGIYNMIGNVWEWVAGGDSSKRILRGGSYVDSIDGSFNHPARVSTRMENSADSSSGNIGFRCASSVGDEKHQHDSTSRFEEKVEL